jgi:hypothetical protein
LAKLLKILILNRAKYEDFKQIAPQTLKPRVSYKFQMPNHMQRSVATNASNSGSLAHFENQKHDPQEHRQTIGMLKQKYILTLKISSF